MAYIASEHPLGLPNRAMTRQGASGVAGSIRASLLVSVSKGVGQENMAVAVARTP